MPFCSVVLATFQGERFIGGQLDSILVQLTPNDEVIVSDDASTDSTVDQIQKRNDLRIRVLRNRERVGYVRNFQRGIEQVRGEYVFFADQDDVWLPGKVTAITSALQRRPLVASDAIVVDENLKEMYRSYFEWRRTKSFSYASMLMKPSIVGATMACRRDYLESQLPLPRYIPHDHWLTLNAAWDNALEVIPTPLILYRRHPAAHSPSATLGRRSLPTIAIERGVIVATMIARRLRKPKR
jgi:glycosyltransferase involved in cell wall biosynthesis